MKERQLAGALGVPKPELAQGPTTADLRRLEIGVGLREMLALPDFYIVVINLNEYTYCSKQPCREKEEGK